MHKTIKQHSGSKYIRICFSCTSDDFIFVDVYAVTEAFRVECPAMQHALKKILCAGIRGKNSTLDDIQEAIDSLYRALEMARKREKWKPRLSAGKGRNRKSDSAKLITATGSDTKPGTMPAGKRSSKAKRSTKKPRTKDKPDPATPT